MAKFSKIENDIEIEDKAVIDYWDAFETSTLTRKRCGRCPNEV